MDMILILCLMLLYVTAVFQNRINFLESEVSSLKNKVNKNDDEIGNILTVLENLDTKE